MQLISMHNRHQPYKKMNIQSIRFLLTAASAAILMAGCKPDMKGELGEITDKVKGLNGTWELEQFIQQDPNNPILEERDLSQFYVREGVEPMRMEISTADRSFTVTQTIGKRFFGNSGTWELDDNIAPSYLTLYGDVDTLRVDLARMVLPASPTMGLVYVRECSDGFRNAIYKFNFKRID
ncbi:MAG: DUF5004 domain-containing protein [Flavobacteriales bacterium]